MNVFSLRRIALYTGATYRLRWPATGAPFFRRNGLRYVATSHVLKQIRVEDNDAYLSHESDNTSSSASKNKDPRIPEGHPIDTDGRPLGAIIPDYDVELPAFSFGGYAKDFQAWEKEPPTYPTTSWPAVAQYDYDELQVSHLPKAYEVNLLVVAYIIGAAGMLLSIIGTRWETGNYYQRYSHFYTSGWPCFHYEPNMDIVPLVPRSDGLPPETPMLSFVNRGDVWKEIPPDQLDDEEAEDADQDNDVNDTAYDSVEPGDATDSVDPDTTGLDITETDPEQASYEDAESD